MTPEISEFSYGFALTNEIVGWSQLQAAPIFPSLIEEGKKGGGYDVKLDRPGIPLYLQFKRAHCMVRRTVTEIKNHHLRLSIPFHRFYITESGTSDQHQLLLELDDGTNAVFYAAPRFHRMEEINDAWTTNAVASQSIFVRPTDIGALDEAAHHVAYDSVQTFLCSDPKVIESLSSAQLANVLTRKVDADPRQFKDKLSGVSAALQGAIQRALPIMSRKAKTRRQKREFSAYAASIDAESKNVPSLRRVAAREPKDLLPMQRELRELADKAQKVFDAQLVIVQRSD